MKIVLMIVFLLGSAVVVEARGPFMFSNKIVNVVGEITKLQDNLVYVKEERSIEKYRFFANSKRLEKFQIGERVRVYFYRGDNRLVSIKKMTLLICGEGRNLGIISGCE